MLIIISLLSDDVHLFVFNCCIFVVLEKVIDLRKFVRWPTLLVIVALIVLTIVPASLSIRNTIGARASGGAAITLSALTGQPGATIQVSGKGFTPTNRLRFFLGPPVYCAADFTFQNDSLSN
jgi:hypothetical protein